MVASSFLVVTITEAKEREEGTAALIVTGMQFIVPGCSCSRAGREQLAARTGQALTFKDPSNVTYFC